jgi:hypothetical protein
MKEVSIKSFAEFHEAVEHLDPINFSYRGQSDSRWNLIPKIGRREYQSNFNEQSSLNAWKRYATGHLEERNMDDWD